MGINDVWMSYVPTFEKLQTQSFIEIFEQEYKDLGFILGSKVFSFIIQDTQMWLCICSVPLLLGVCKLIEKKSVCPGTSFVLFFGLGYFGYNVFLIRQSIALGFLLLAFLSYEDNKKLRAAILMTIAATFHVTVLLALLLLPMKAIAKNRNWRVFSLCILAALALFGSFIFIDLLTALNFKRFNFYLELLEKDKEQLNDTILYINLVIFAFMFVCSCIGKYNKTVRCDVDRLPQQVLEGSLLLSASFGTGLITLVSMTGNIYRVALYFLVYEIVLLPNLIHSAFPRTRRLIRMALVIVFVAYFLFNQIDNQQINPFIFFWEK